MANVPAPEVRVSPVTGIIPENAKEMANPSVENGGVVPPSPHSTQLSHLMKKEARLQTDKEAFKKEQEEFKALKARVQEVYDKAENFEKTRKVDPVKALKELGFSEKEIIDYLSIDDPELSPEERAQRAAQAEIKKFRDEEAEKALQARKNNDSQLVEKFKKDVSALIQADLEKYELCAHYGPAAEQLIFDIAVEEAKEKRPIDIASIAEDVEKFYIEDFDSVKKLKKLTPHEEAIVEEAKEIQRSRVVHPPQEIVKPRATTLTNKITATSASLAKPTDRVETRDEKRARLEQMIRGGLIR